MGASVDNSLQKVRLNVLIFWGGSQRGSHKLSPDSFMIYGKHLPAQKLGFFAKNCPKRCNYMQTPPGHILSWYCLCRSSEVPHMKSSKIGEDRTPSSTSTSHNFLTIEDMRKIKIASNISTFWSFQKSTSWYPETQQKQQKQHFVIYCHFHFLAQNHIF